MATIIEVQDTKIEHLSECAEKVLKYSSKLMKCLEELEERSGEHYMERYGKRRRREGMREFDNEEYPRYY